EGRGAIAGGAHAHLGEQLGFTGALPLVNEVPEAEVEQRVVNWNDPLAGCGLKPLVGLLVFRPLRDNEAVHAVDPPNVSYVELAGLIQAQASEHRQQWDPEPSVAGAFLTGRGVAVSVVAAAGVERCREDSL